jgi:hypothetical protein
VTVPAKLPVTFWNTAETVTDPTLIAVRRPREPAALDTAALVVTPPSAPDTIQVTLFVMSADVGGVSAHVPVAVSCWLPPTATLRGFGVIAIELRVALLTVTCDVPETPW